MQKEFTQKLTNLVEANLANEKFGPEELARETGMSHSTLNRKLKTISNQNVSQFIREIRLKKGKELLLNEDLTIAEIAYRVGFGSPTYFNKCFHRYFGYAPGEMRNYNPEEEPAKQIVEPPTKKGIRPKIMVGIAVILVVLIPLSYFLIKSAVNETIRDKSIAVLPFKYLSDETEKQYLVDGLMDAVLTNLSKIRDLRVVSRTSVEQYRESHKSAKEIGREQNVAYLLEGSFQKENNQVRLILQLIKTRNENHVWSEIYDRQWKDIFTVQSEVAEAVASELQVAITPEERQRIRKIPTTNLTAYDFYLRGKDELERDRISNNGDSIALKKAKYHFQKALELDSTFALAYTGLADVYYRKNFWKTYLSEHFMDSVLILANKALTYDIQCSDAYGLRAVTYYQIGQLSEALKEIDKILKLDPNDWWAYYFLYFFSDNLQDFVGAISNLNEAILRNRGPRLPKLLSKLSGKLTDYGFFDLGKKYNQQALKLDGDTLQYLSNLAWVEYCEGNFEKAYQIEKSIYIRDTTWIDNFPMYCSRTGRYEEGNYFELKRNELLKKAGEIELYNSKTIGYYLWQAGRKKEAEFYFDQQIKICEESIRLGRWNALQKGAHFDLAGVYACKGDKEKTYYYLDEVNKNRAFPTWWVILFKHDPLFEPIRQEPRFQKILKDVEAKYQAEHERVGKWLVEQGIM
jgi:TolB-like protein/AraC-like DNA-binding protein/Tfp pilus assembly protein PilF